MNHGVYTFPGVHWVKSSVCEVCENSCQVLTLYGHTNLMSADDLNATIQSALTTLDPGRKAEFLLDTALTLIDTGR